MSLAGSKGMGRGPVSGDNDRTNLSPPTDGVSTACCRGPDGWRTPHRRTFGQRLGSGPKASAPTSKAAPRSAAGQERQDPERAALPPPRGQMTRHDIAIPFRGAAGPAGFGGERLDVVERGRHSRLCHRPDERRLMRQRP